MNTQQYHKKQLLKPTLILLVLMLSISPAPGVLADDTVEEPLLARELKKGISTNYNMAISVNIVINQESKLQDLIITPKGDRAYSTGSFIYAVVHAVSVATKKTLAYKIYTGMVIIDINGELYAISAENCRKVFKSDTVEEQNEVLRKNLKKLR